MSRELKAEPHRHLYVSWSTAAQIWVLRANIGRHGDGQKPDSAAGRVNSIRCPVHNVIGVQWIGKIRVVEDVEYINAQLHRHTLGDLVFFAQGQIEIPEMRAVEGISPQVAKRSGRRLERGQVQESVWRVRSCERITHQVWTLDEFATAFSDADSLTLLDIYAASEAPIPGINAELLVGRINAQPGIATGNRALYADSFEIAVELALAQAEAGDMVLTLGAGNVSQVGPMLLERLAARESAAHPQSARG